MTDPFSTDDQADNFVSFNFLNDSGYDRTQATVHGTAEYVAELFAVEDFDGKISTLMKRATEIEAFFKGLKALSPKASGR